MKKKLLTFIILFVVTFGLSGLLFHTSARAEQTVSAYQIQISQFPSKTTYTVGESLNLSDMVVQGYFYDGTSKAITDYTITGYDSSNIGVQTVLISYQNLYASFNVTVIPAKVKNIKVSSRNTTSLTLSWDAQSNITRYEIYTYDSLNGTYNLNAVTGNNNITLYYDPGTIHKFQICAVSNIYGTEYKGELSDAFTAATNPNAATGLTVTQTTASTVSLSWNAVPGATGYLIYRSPDTANNYKNIGTSSSTIYTDKFLSSGTGYKYKVVAYILDKTNTGGYSNEIQTSTNPAKIVLKYKAGDKKIRLTWARITGAYSYDIYMGDAKTGAFKLLTTNSGNANISCIADGLVTGNTYSFYAIAHRYYNGNVYDSQPSDITTVKVSKIASTSSAAKLFKTKTDFVKSSAYKIITFFNKNVDYTRSFIIPGMVNTNVGGFSSTTMVPQGIAIARNYILFTAYDSKAEENSVIYVMDKKTKKLLTTLILPSKNHAGSIGYDGTNVWVANGSRISSIPYSVFDAAAKKGTPYAYINYNTTCSLGISASYITYYNNKLWVGSYNELQTTNMYSYTIQLKDTKPALTKTDTVVMPTRVQGVSFTSDGYLILSRSCQLYKGLRGYMRQIDVYKPDFKKERNGILPLGNIVNTVEMPSMNEDIAVYGSYLYVNFESGAFGNASYRMDRVCAFKLSSIIKKPVKK